jgi:hypothetical protein
MVTKEIKRQIFIIDRKLAELTIYNKTYWTLGALAIPQPLFF